MASVTVRLSDSSESQLERASRTRGVSKSDFVRKALERYLRQEALRDMRGMLTPYLEAQGIHTEHDVFKGLGETL